MSGFVDAIWVRQTTEPLFVSSVDDIDALAYWPGGRRHLATHTVGRGGDRRATVVAFELPEGWYGDVRAPRGCAGEPGCLVRTFI